MGRRFEVLRNLAILSHLANVGERRADERRSVFAGEETLGIGNTAESSCAGTSAFGKAASVERRGS